MIKHILPLLAIVLMLASCSKGPSYTLCYSDGDGNTVVTDGTTKEMLKTLKKSKWPYTWDEENLKLTVGEIDAEIEKPFPMDTIDQQFVIQFKPCPEGIIVEEATVIKGEHKVVGLGSHKTVPEEHFVMNHAAAVDFWRHLGKYEK